MSGFTAPEIAWGPMVPVLVVLLAAVVGVLVEAFVPAARRRLVQLVLTLASLAGALLAIAALWSGVERTGGTDVLGGSLVVDGPTLVLQATVALLALLSTLVFADRVAGGEDAFAPSAAAVPGSDYEELARAKGLRQTEVFPLLLFATGGMRSSSSSASDCVARTSLASAGSSSSRWPRTMVSGVRSSCPTSSSSSRCDPNARSRRCSIELTDDARSARSSLPVTSMRSDRSDSVTRRTVSRSTRTGRSMAKLTTDELIDAFKELTLIELSEFVKAFEEVFEVTAAAPAAVAVAAPAGGGADAPVEEEKDSFDVVLEAAGDKKIQVIKEVRTLTSLGLKEAKDLVDGAPKPVLEGVNKETAEKAKAALEGAGATISLK